MHMTRAHLAAASLPTWWRRRLTAWAVLIAALLLGASIGLIQMIRGNRQAAIAQHALYLDRLSFAVLLPAYILLNVALPWAAVSSG